MSVLTSTYPPRVICGGGWDALVFLLLRNPRSFDQMWAFQDDFSLRLVRRCL